MAYSTRGTRPIVVNGMSFRWRTDDALPRVVVWHVLDAGVLTITFPDPRFTPTPGFVARAIQRALENGWRTDHHVHIEQSIEEFRETDGFSNRSRVIALPGLDDMLDHEAELLRAPDLEDPETFPDSGAVLQAVLAPTFAPACAITLWAEGESGYAHLIGIEDGERQDWLVEADADWIRDAIVSVRTARPGGEGRIMLDGMPTRIAIRDLAGSWTDTDNHPEEGTPVRVALLAVWHQAMQAFAGVEPARELIEGLHPYVAPGTLPFARDDEHRILRLYGAWSWPLGEQLVVTLRTCKGPWIVDARRTVLAGLTIRAVQAHLRKRGAPTFWVVGREQPSPDLRYHDLEHAETARGQAARDAVRRAIQTFDPRWRGIATEALLARDAARVSAAQVEIQRWLGEGWSGVAELDPAGWAFTGDGWDWVQGRVGPGLVVGADHVWLRTPDGELRVCALP